MPVDDENDEPQPGDTVIELQGGVPIVYTLPEKGSQLLPGRRTGRKLAAAKTIPTASTNCSMSWITKQAVRAGSATAPLTAAGRRTACTSSAKMASAGWRDLARESCAWVPRRMPCCGSGWQDTVAARPAKPARSRSPRARAMLIRCSVGTWAQLSSHAIIPTGLVGCSTTGTTVAFVISPWRSRSSGRSASTSGLCRFSAWTCPTSPSGVSSKPAQSRCCPNGSEPSTGNLAAGSASMLSGARSGHRGCGMSSTSTGPVFRASLTSWRPGRRHTGERHRLCEDSRVCGHPARTWVSLRPRVPPHDD